MTQRITFSFTKDFSGENDAEIEDKVNEFILDHEGLPDQMFLNILREETVCTEPSD